MSIFGPPGPPFWGPGARFSGTFFSVYFRSGLRRISGPPPGAEPDVGRTEGRGAAACVFGHFTPDRCFHRVFIAIPAFGVSGAAEREITCR